MSQNNYGIIIKKDNLHVLHYYKIKIVAWLKMRSSLFWDVTQITLVITDSSGQPRSPIFKSTKKMGPKGCLGISVTDYQSTLRNNPEEWGTDLHIGVRLKSRVTENNPR